MEENIGRKPKEMISGLSVKNAVKIDATYNLSQRWGLNPISLARLLLFLEGSIRMKMAGLGIRNSNLDSQIRRGDTTARSEQALKLIKDRFRADAIPATKGSNSGVSISDGIRALDVDKYFQEGEKMSQRKDEEEADKIIRENVSPEALKSAANLISFKYLSLLDEVRQKHMPIGLAERQLEETILQIKIR